MKVSSLYGGSLAMGWNINVEVPNTTGQESGALPCKSSFLRTGRFMTGGSYFFFTARMPSLMRRRASPGPRTSSTRYCLPDSSW
jgi:hypothetical protein